MLETLVINGKMYQPSDQAALFVDQPVTYVEQLARGKWIDASFVHGRCFVDVDSLVRFLVGQRTGAVILEAEQAERQVAAERLREYMTITASVGPKSTFQFVIQSGVVVLCGCLIGLVSWSAVDAGLTAATLRAGAASVIESVSTQVFPWTANNSYEVNVPAITPVQYQFSDEVTVTRNADGRAYVTPQLQPGTPPAPPIVLPLE